MNDARMEKCVKGMMTKGHSKSSAVAICKASMFGKKKMPGKMPSRIDKEMMAG